MNRRIQRISRSEILITTRLHDEFRLDINYRRTRSDYLVYNISLINIVGEREKTLLSFRIPDGKKTWHLDIGFAIFKVNLLYPTIRDAIFHHMIDVINSDIKHFIDGEIAELLLDPRYYNMVIEEHIG